MWRIKSRRLDSHQIKPHFLCCIFAIQCVHIQGLAQYVCSFSLLVAESAIPVPDSKCLHTHEEFTGDDAACNPV